MIPRITTAAVGTLALLIALTACAGSTTPAPARSTPAAPPPPVATTEPVEQPEPVETPAQLTCESMITGGTVDALVSSGWTGKPKDFMVGDVDLSAGLLCFWADYGVASDHGQLYGWAPISTEDAAKAQTTLISSGWKREDGAEGIYLTEDPKFAMSLDENGYGMTYLFGDGWVKLADTKQGLILIDWQG